MQKIAILTDSASDLPFEEIKENNIYLAPFRIIYSDKEFEDKFDIQPDDVYNSLQNEIPSTSLPNMEKVELALKDIEEKGYTHVIVITISSGLSGTYNGIRLMLEDHPNLKSHIFDTKTLTIAEGLLVRHAAEMVKSGKTFDEIIAILPKLRERTHAYFTLETLEYLIHGGRIGKVAGTIGQILNLKPIIVVGDDGIYHTYAKVRGRKQSISRLLSVANEYLSKGKCNIHVVHGVAEEVALEVLEELKKSPNLCESSVYVVGPALGVHTGPGLIGMVIEEV